MGVPDRWLDYCPYGEVIKGTRFLPFKVPLKQTLCDMLEKENRFNIPVFLEGLQTKGLKLGLVIDLTNTARYYFKKDFEQQGVLYAKIYTEGHVVPSDQVYGKFFGIIEKFLDANKYSDAIIGVHCTHGVNRTGQLLCRYMIEKLHMDPQMALEAFREARGHSIERDLYISDLLQRRPGTSDPSVDWRSEEFEAWGVEVPKERKPRHRHQKAAAEGRWEGNQDPSLGHWSSGGGGGPENWRDRARLFKREIHPYSTQLDAWSRNWREDGGNCWNGLDQGSQSRRDDGGNFKNGWEPYRSQGSRRRTRWSDAGSSRNGPDAHYSQGAWPGGWSDDGHSTNGHGNYSQQGAGAERWRGSSGNQGNEQSGQQDRGPATRMNPAGRPWNGPSGYWQQHAGHSSQGENGQQTWSRPHSSPLYPSASKSQVDGNSLDGSHSSPHVASQSAFVMNATYPPPQQQGWNPSLYPALSCPQQGGNVFKYNNPNSTHGATSVGTGRFQDHFPQRSSSDWSHVDHRQSAQRYQNHSQAPKQD